MQYGFLLMGVHMLFSLAFFVGLVLFIVWAARELKGKKLLNAALALMVLGFILAFLTMSFGFSRGMMGWDEDEDGEWRGRMMYWNYDDEDEEVDVEVTTDVEAE